MSNRANGNQFEAELCQMLADRGFWVHNMKQDASGQPADIIAVKGKNTYLIDAKDCKKNVFSLSRIEWNQELAMQLFSMIRDSEDLDTWFALKMGDKVYFASLKLMMYYRDKLKMKNIKEGDGAFLDIDKWVEIYGS